MKDGIMASGEYILTTCNVEGRGAKVVAREIELIAEWGKALVDKASGQKDLEQRIKKAWNEYHRAVQDFHRQFTVRQIVVRNKVVNQGLELLARRLSGDTTYTGILNNCAIGTGTTAGAAGDTALVAEIFRKITSGRSFTANQIFTSTFFTAPETSGTIGEVAHFVDGFMFSRIGDPDTTELPITKTTSETLTVEYKCTFTAT